MTEPDTAAQGDEVDDNSEQALSPETNSMHAQVKPLIQTTKLDFFFLAYPVYTKRVINHYVIKDSK